MLYDKLNELSMNIYFIFIIKNRVTFQLGWERHGKIVDNF